MLDAFIIEKIRRERERREPGLHPLRIEVPRRPDGWAPDDMSPDDMSRDSSDGWGRERGHQDERPGRGVTIIDYSI